LKKIGKCKEEFKKYVESRDDIDLLQFEISCSAMQYGVYVDFFDSVGIAINIDKKSYTQTCAVTINAVYLNNGKEITIFKTRQEARTKAIEKANEIFNKQLNE